MTLESEVVNTHEESPKKKLPGVRALFFQGWKYTKNNVALIGVLSLPFILVDILAYLGEISTGQLNSVLNVINGVVTLLALIGYVLLMATVLYLVTHQSQHPRFADGFAWAKGHFWSVLWISILTGLAVWGGFLLLLVPGIIVAIYVTLSQMVLATEGAKGMSALLRSRELVYGNWWAVFGRILGVQFLYCFVIIGVGIVVGMGTAFSLSEPHSELFNNILFTILGSVGTLIFLSATYQLYTTLKERAQSIPVSSVPAAATKYQVLTWLGLLSIIVFTIAAISMALHTSADIFTAQKNRLLEAGVFMQLGQIQTQAQQYVAQQPEGSFAGVCDALQVDDFRDGLVVCTESDTAYALTVEHKDTLYCIDATGYKKIIYTALDGRTQCLPL